MELLYLPMWGGVLSSHYCLHLLVKLRRIGSAVNKCRFQTFYSLHKAPCVLSG